MNSVLDRIIQVWNINGLNHQVAKIKDFETLFCGKDSIPLTQLAVSTLKRYLTCMTQIGFNLYLDTIENAENILFTLHSLLNFLNVESQKKSKIFDGFLTKYVAIYKEIENAKFFSILYLSAKVNICIELGIPNIFA